jgi:hypothetical protein
VVHYVAYGTPGGEFPAGVCRAAIITEVYSLQHLPSLDTDKVYTVDEQGGITAAGLCVLNPTGQFFNRGVNYDGSATPTPGTWHWPERV